MKKILIADDNTSIQMLLDNTFASAGFDVVLASDGEQALELVKTTKFDALVLDMMMPGYSGLEVIQQLRRENDFTPALILTAREDDELRIKGLDEGADDYVDKSIPQKELVSRIKALIRRAMHYQTPANKGLIVDNANKAVILNGKEIDLSKREFDLLRFLRDANRVVSRDEIIIQFWGNTQEFETRIVDVTISNLRKKLGNDFIKTKRGFGYSYHEN